MNTHPLAHGIVSSMPDLNSRNRLFVNFFFFFAKIDVFSKVFLLVFRGLTGTGNLATQKKV